jgi:hypothetical protein
MPQAWWRGLYASGAFAERPLHHRLSAAVPLPVPGRIDAAPRLASVIHRA